MFRSRMFNKPSQRSEIFDDYFENDVDAGGSYVKELHIQKTTIDYPKGSTQIACEKVDENKCSITHNHDDYIMSFYKNDDNNNK